MLRDSAKKFLHAKNNCELNPSGSAQTQRQLTETAKETTTETAPPIKRAFSNYRIKSQWGGIVIYASEFVFK